MEDSRFSPPTTDLSRANLRRAAAWIRDELDLIVAREGPEKLCIDDVLALHELFQALRTSTSLTAMDLRATGIHKAVMEVAGIATRWPGRLADDCDKIIAVWRTRFGRLEDLHPFMYGRSGRLEGIAQADEFSKTVLLKRWNATCPERLAVEKSHRHGDLGFKPGDWWISPIFAHHAGIIDLDSVEGGICHDKDGAYAVLLANSGEIDGLDGTSFKYRPQQGDRGKFRLTAASPKSRHPIRVLRDHSLNSTLGPKAGVRYDGLYRIAGWTVRTAKSGDAFGTSKRGDIIYEIQLERIDPVPYEDVLKHPTSHELDDYVEYKRLRRAHRENKHIAPNTLLAPPDAPDQSKTAASSQTRAIVSQLQSQLRRVSPSSSNRTAFRDAVTAIKGVPLGKPSPASSAGSVGQSIRIQDKIFDGRLQSMLSREVGGSHKTEAGSATRERAESDPQLSLRTPSIHDAGAAARGAVIAEVAPWVNYDPEVLAAATGINARPSRPLKASSAEKTSRRSSTYKLAQRRSGGSIPSIFRVDGSDGDWHSVRVGPFGRTPFSRRTGSSTQAPVERTGNPLAKILDGAEDGATAYGAQNGEDYFSLRPRRAVSVGTTPTGPMGRPLMRSSSSSEAHPISPTPVRPLRPASALVIRNQHFDSLPLAMRPLSVLNSRSGSSALCSPSPASCDGDYIALSKRHLKASISPRHPLTSLKDFITAAKPAAPVSSSPTVSTQGVLPDLRPLSAEPLSAASIPGAGDGTTSSRLCPPLQDGAASATQVAFRDPFELFGLHARSGSQGSVEKLSPGTSAG